MKQPCKAWCPLGQNQDKNNPICLNCKARVLYAKYSALEDLYSADQIKKISNEIRSAVPVSPIKKPSSENSKPKKNNTPLQIKGFCPRCGKKNDRLEGLCHACRLYIKRHRPIGVDGCKECLTPGCTRPGNYSLGYCQSCYNKRRYWEKKNKKAA